MRISKRIVIAAAAALAVTMGGAQAQDMMKLKIGTEGAYPPFNNLEADGSLVGFDIDIAKALCAPVVLFQASLKLVTTKSVMDLLSLMSKTGSLPKVIS